MKHVLVVALFVVVFMPRASVADIPSVDFVDGRVTELSDAVVHLAGDETITGAKTFTGNVQINNLNAGADGAVTLTTGVDAASNNNQVATTEWTNDRIIAAKGDIPVGGRDATTFTKIWIEE